MLAILSYQPPPLGPTLFPSPSSTQTYTLRKMVKEECIRFITRPTLVSSRGQRDFISFKFQQDQRTPFQGVQLDIRWCIGAVCSLQTLRHSADAKMLRTAYLTDMEGSSYHPAYPNKKDQMY